MQYKNNNKYVYPNIKTLELLLGFSAKYLHQQL